VTGDGLSQPRLGHLVSQYFAGDLHAAVGVAGLMSGVGRYARFVDQIVARYLSALTELEVAQARRNMDSNPSMITPSERALFRSQEVIQLEIESFYLFAKILLDRWSGLAEAHFGPARRLSLHSHDQLTRQFEKYAEAKGLSVVSSLLLSSIKTMKARFQTTVTTRFLMN
jgi:hypothetical protein